MSLNRTYFLEVFVMPMLLFVLVPHESESKASDKLKPVIDGEWWQIAGNPNLGELSSDDQQPVDFGIWQANDGTWQLWSCIRNTKEPGKTRLFYGWEGKALTDNDWEGMGIKMQADPTLGETAGGMQAPHVIREDDKWNMFYGDWNAICMATSSDGKKFERVVQDNMERVTAMFTDGAGTNSRDAVVLKIHDTYYCYYTSGAGLWSEEAYKADGAVYCRTSRDKVHWSERISISRGGSVTGPGWGAHECPHVVKVDDYYYLFRTQRYGKNNISTVYGSKDPLNFGIDTDHGYYVTRLPVAAPELIRHEGTWYIAALKPGLDGIRMARLKWITLKEN